MSAPDTALDRAKAAWGEPLPDWIEELALECDRTNQAAVARRLERSPALVSNVLQNKYPNMSAIEPVVRGVLMKATVNCPVVGDLATDTCLKHQRATWAPHNPQRIQFYKACRNQCPHSRIGGKHHAE